MAAGAPLLGVPSLAAAAADGANGTTVSVFLRLALKEEDEEERRNVVEKEQKQQQEDFERRMLALNHRVRHDLPLTDAELAAWRRWSDKALSSSSSAGKRRKRKKKRKKKVPKSSSRAAHSWKSGHYFPRALHWIRHRLAVQDKCARSYVRIEA